MNDNPYAPPQSPTGLDAPVRSTTGLRHYFLLLFTAWMLSYVALPAYFLWEAIRNGALSPLLGLLLAVGCTSLTLGVARAFYRPWLGKLAFCAALAASGVYLICCMNGVMASLAVIDEGRSVVAALSTVGLAAWGLVMSVRARQ